MYIEIPKLILKEIKNITKIDYLEFEREDMGFVLEEYILPIIEDLVDEYKEIDEKLRHIKEDVEENYKRINWEEDYD